MVTALRIIFLVFCFIFGCSAPQARPPFEEIRLLMDTAVRIKIYESSLSHDELSALADSCFRLMADIERRVSSYDDSSETSKLNRLAGEPVRVSHELLTLLRSAEEVSKASRGHFDITIGVLVPLWGFSTGLNHVPEKGELKKALKYVDYRNIAIQGNTVALKKGMRIDLGAIAKGYVVDRAVEMLQASGVRSGLVEAGGDLRLFGKPPHRERWRIGIKHPREFDRSIFGVLELDSKAVTTSGDYERQFVENGIGYHHLLNPFTGMPANRCVSVTIVTESAMYADAWATAAFILGPEEGMKLLVEEDVEGLIIVESDGRLDYAATPGLAADITFKD